MVCGGAGEEGRLGVFRAYIMSTHFSNFVIPAKAGIHHLMVIFQMHCPMKPEVPVMDSRIRGNDEHFSSLR
jgi:hypothetical protein